MPEAAPLTMDLPQPGAARPYGGRSEEARTAPPRVLMVLKRDLGGGGMQQQARRVSLTLRRAGVPVTLVSHARDRGKHHRSYARYLPTRFLHASHQWGFAAALFRHLVRYRRAYDVAHIHGFGPEVTAALAARLFTGRRVVVKPSTAGPGTKLNAYARWTRIFPLLAPLLWRQVDAWISISAQTRADLLRMGISPSRIADAPNGVDRSFRPLPAEERVLLRAELGLQPGDVLIVTAARLTPHKRVDLLLRAFLRVVRTQPHARLWIMGDGEQAEELRAMLQDDPLQARVRVMGHVLPSQLLRAYQAADLFALVSLWEGLSNSLLEAMACGLPPVVSRVSGMADVVDDGTTGLVVPADNEEAVVGALETLIRDEGARRKLGDAAARKIDAQFRIAATAERLLEIYRACLAGQAVSCESALCD